MPDRDTGTTGIEAILGDARPRETIVRVCVAGDLAGRLDQLIERRQGLARTSLGGDGAAEVDAEIADVREQMAGRTHAFTFRALPAKAWSDLLAAHPDPGKTRAFNVDTFPLALVAACCADPQMDAGQAGRLFDALNEGARSLLFDAAWQVNTGAVPVPFSASA